VIFLPGVIVWFSVRVFSFVSFLIIIMIIIVIVLVIVLECLDSKFHLVNVFINLIDCLASLYKLHDLISTVKLRHTALYLSCLTNRRSGL